MTAEEIAIAMGGAKHPNVYVKTYLNVQVFLKNGNSLEGYFTPAGKYEVLAKENKWTFIEQRNKKSFNDTGDLSYVTVVNGDDIVKIEK